MLKFRAMRLRRRPRAGAARGGERGRRRDLQDPRRPARDADRARSCAASRSTSCRSSCNVLRGEMSLIGPRPLPMRDYARLDAWHRKRYLVLPGITGLWQISGRSNLGFDDMVRLDFYYLEHWSVWLDVTILARTPAAVLTGRGAFSGGGGRRRRRRAACGPRIACRAPRGWRRRTCVPRRRLRHHARARAALRRLELRPLRRRREPADGGEPVQTQGVPQALARAVAGGADEAASWRAALRVQRGCERGRRRVLVVAAPLLATSDRRLLGALLATACVVPAFAAFGALNGLVNGRQRFRTQALDDAASTRCCARPASSGSRSPSGSTARSPASRSRRSPRTRCSAASARRARRPGAAVAAAPSLRRRDGRLRRRRHRRCSRST